MSRNRNATYAIIGTLALLALIAVAATVIGAREPAPGKGEDHPEVHRILPELRAAEDTFQGAFGDWETLGPCPVALPGAEAAPLGDSCVRTWAGLGVEDPGPVRCQYDADAQGIVKANCDLDGDGVVAVYRIEPGGELERVTPETAR